MRVSLKMEAGNGTELCMGPRFINIDPDTHCAFRRNNVALINESFVLVLARRRPENPGSKQLPWRAPWGTTF